MLTAHDTVSTEKLKPKCHMLNRIDLGKHNMPELDQDWSDTSRPALWSALALGGTVGEVPVAGVKSHIVPNMIEKLRPEICKM